MLAKSPDAAPKAATVTQSGASNHASHRATNKPPKNVDFASTSRVQISACEIEKAVMFASYFECWWEI